jgi:hypothetical protein
MAIYGTSLTCPSCGRFYQDISTLAEAGGSICSIGLGLFATCGGCGKRWPVNDKWRLAERIVENGKKPGN